MFKLKKTVLVVIQHERQLIGISKNPKDIQRKPKETGTEELEQQVGLALERALSRQLAPVMLKLADKPAVPKEQDPSGKGGSEYLIVSFSCKG